MKEEKLKEFLNELRALPQETEWVEFKLNYGEPQSIGEYISALANSVCLHKKRKAYLVFGIEDETHNILGTTFKPKKKKIGNEELENWLIRQLEPAIDFVIHEFQSNGKSIVLFEIDPATDTPVKFRNVAYIRVGSYKKKLAAHPEKERKIWKNQPDYDWSSQICEDATLDDLSPEAILKARTEYKKKYRHLAKEVDVWDDLTFLNKARIIKKGKITRTAIILLGKEESDHFLSPSVSKITWVLKDDNNVEKDYMHFGSPFILSIEKVFSYIRNLNYRYLPDGTLFPIEVSQYDPWVMREALHNCIAHQDYDLRGRINVVEKADELIFTNLGHFIPGSVENVIEENCPPEYYRNPFLSNAMVNLNMIDTIGGGIRKMFLTQWQRFFPMPDYDLSQEDRVVVRIAGKILNENYTRLLMNKTDLDLNTVILLDKVQKGIFIDKNEHKHLRKLKLTEGRYPNIYIAGEIASITGEKAKYIKDKGLDSDYYKGMVRSFIKKYKSASRKDIEELLMDKLPDVLNEDQKKRKVGKLLFVMSKKEGIIKNVGSRKLSKWVFVD